MKGSLVTLAALLGAAAAGGLDQRSPHKHHGIKHPNLKLRGHPTSAPNYSEAPDYSDASAHESEDCACTTKTIIHTYVGQATLAPAPPMQSSEATDTDSTEDTATNQHQDSEGSISSTTSDSSSSAPGYSSSEKLWAITYSPYQGSSSSSSSCKSAEQVMQDIGSISSKGFSAVRIYGTDCGQVENVLAACEKYGMKVILGIFIEEAGICQDSYDQLKEITTACHGKWDMVELVVVGNEAIFNGYTTAGEMASFITHCKTELQDCGYKGWVTTTDTVAAFQAGAEELCPVIDCVGANMHPFFNGNVEPSDAGSFVASQVQLLKNACPNKEVYNFETGWPTQGPNYDNSVPSPENQAACLKSLQASDHCGRTVFFSMENDMWKNDGSPSVEPYWGCLDQFSDE